MRTITTITNRLSIIKAIDECNTLGHEAFLEKYNYKQSRSYFLLYKGLEYPSKAIVGVAYRFQHSSSALAANEFNGGNATVRPLLENLGFTVIQRSVDDQPEKLPEEVSGNYDEGNVIQVKVNKYERSRAARKACIEIHGTVCIACSADLGKIYGAKYQGFIHIHHVRPLSTLKANYKVSPEKDLVPLCPNCHAIVHFSQTPLSISQLKQLISKE
ncbi:HNH endonuclease [Photobacterium kagoshimensis]|uniref:HNH endonuclease n=1 Tax=Photobacterium kagoshimensis TaxID=2910242 RepID=UPI003D0F2E46